VKLATPLLGIVVKVRALIGPMSSAAGRQGIARLLAAPPRRYRSAIAADQSESWDDVLERLAAEPFDVLIAEFGAGSPEIDRLFQLQPKLSVIEVDLAGGTTNVHVFDVGSETLVRLAEWLSREAGLAGANDTVARVTHARPRLSTPANESHDRPADPPAPVPAPPRTETRLVATRPDPYADPDEQLDDLDRWLTLGLNLALARAESETAGQDVSSWTMSAARARTLLGRGAAALPLPDLAAKFGEADATLAGRSLAAPDLPLARLCASFELDEVERRMLYFALAPELDGRFAQVFGFLADDLSQRRPNASVVAELIDGSGAPWRIGRRLSGDRPFARFGLVASLRADLPGAPDTQIPLALPADVTAFLLGRGTGQPGGCRRFDPADPVKLGFDRQAAPVVAAARSAGRATSPPPVVRLAGAEGEELWLAEQLAGVGLPVLVGTLAPPPADSPAAEIEDKLRMFARQARLGGSILIVAGLDSVPETLRRPLCAWAATTFADHLKLLVLQGRHVDPVWLAEAPGGVLEIARETASREERAAIWSRAAAARGMALPAEAARELAATFAFTRGQAEAALALAIGGGGGDSPEAAGEALRHAGRIVSKASAPPAVRRVETGLGWNDIVLPAAIEAELRRIPAHVRHAQTVWEQWGFGERVPYGQGIAALFAGPSGTGKTMAAQILARELGSALFQVDLAKTVSKYIGETEKALDAIFDAAEAASAVLLFDEADALFGKRSEVKDAHDRYANLEVAYLLQRIEAYRGLAVLTTNFKENLDSAFLRRLRFIVDFPMPDAEHRLAIWTRMFPEEAPVAEDVDVSLLARQLPMSGGNIEQSVVNAAFQAAEDGSAIRMSHLVAATRAELAKIGMESAGRSLTRLLTGTDQAGIGS
jgi:ATPase family associated with various cellular activities (AAA)